MRVSVLQRGKTRKEQECQSREAETGREEGEREDEGRVDSHVDDLLDESFHHVSGHRFSNLEGFKGTIST